MSHEINCPECNYINTPGSKFCNNCGAKLPLSTHILCPNCSISNTRDRVFCDHCGSRLIPIPGKSAKPEEPEVQEPASSPNIFALPTRKPGETGELDPSKLPDWLSREMAQQKAQSEDDEIPPIEEFHSDKRQTDDLPDWLIHESDPEPIINAPTIISTEFYLDLVDKADDLPDLDDLLLDREDELMQEAKNAELPDWLSEANSIPDLTKSSPSKESLPKPEEIFSDIPDNSWMEDLEPDTPTKQEDEKPEWLADAVTANDQDESGVTEWLSGLEVTTSETTSHNKASAHEESGLTEWLSDLDSNELKVDETPEAPIDLFADDVFEDEEDDDNDTDDWLNDLSADSNEKTAVQDTAVQKDQPPLFTESFPEPEDDDDSWWDDFPEEEEDDQPQQSVQSIEMSVFVSESIPESDDNDDWWDDFPEEESNDNEQPQQTSVQPDEVVIQESIPESDDDDDWWDDFSDEGEDVPETTEAQPLAAVILGDILSDEISDETAVPEWESVTNEQFNTLFEDATIEETEFPDWLSAAENDTDTLLSQQTGETSSENLANTQSLIHNAETDWLADLEGVTSETPELSGDFLGLDEAEESFVDDFIALPEEMDSESNWLSDLSAIDTGQLIIEAEADLENLPSEEADLPEIDEPTKLEKPIQEQSSSQEAQDNWGSDDDTLFELDEDDTMPDWMNQLGEASNESISSNALPPLSSDEDLPAWIASMRPDDNNYASEFSGTLSTMEPEIPESLEGLPFDLGGGDLPDWLVQDQSSKSSTSAIIQEFSSSGLDENPEIPDWLKADSGDSDTLIGGDSDDNWVSMLDELPGVVPLASTLARANLPAWVEELRPAELDNKAGKRPIPEGPEETEGPLAGLRGVVAIEAAITQPHSVNPVQQFMVTPEQKNQIALLQQILHEESGAGTVVSAKSQKHLSLALRLVLTLLLVGAIVMGLRAVSLAKASFDTVPMPVSAVNTAVLAAEELPVLVAFEYPPALSGELSPQAETLMRQLAAQNSEILTISQYPSGTAIADGLGDKYSAENLGYLPGNAIGLRQLSDCLSGQSACETLVGHTVEAGTRQKLKNIGLIIVVTGNKESLTNWVEQVGVYNDIPISAGVTTALAPSASPYFATAQLSGYLGGLLDTAVYQDLINNKTQKVNQLLNAQLLGQLLVATILLIGVIVYGISGSLSKRGKK